MIKTIITAGVLFILPTLALSQQIVQKPVLCDTTAKMLPFFEQQYGETPFWIGAATKADDGWYALMVNQETKTWSMVQYNREVSCLIGEGKDFRIPEKSAKKPNL